MPRQNQKTSLTLAAMVAGVQSISIRPASTPVTATDLAQQFVNDKHHTCDFAHRRMADEEQPNYQDVISAKDNWEDATFPRDDAIDWDDVAATYRSLDWIADSSYLSWSRMSETYPEADGYSLLGTDGFNPADVKQGSIGNCWFLAAASAVAEIPQRFEVHWLTKEFNEAGIYALNMYQLGVPITVLVDDWVPHYGSTWTTVFAKV